MRVEYDVAIQKILSQFCNNFQSFMEISEKLREWFEIRTINIKCYILSNVSESSISSKLVYKAN